MSTHRRRKIRGLIVLLSCFLGFFVVIVLCNFIASGDDDDDDDDDGEDHVLFLL